MNHYRTADNIIAAINHIDSQAAIARLCGVSAPAVHKWKSRKALPKREHIEAIAEHLGVHPSVIEFGDLAAELDTRPKVWTVEPNWTREAGEWVRYWTAPGADRPIAAVVTWLDDNHSSASWMILAPEGDSSKLPSGEAPTIRQAKDLAEASLRTVEAMWAAV